MSKTLLLLAVLAGVYFYSKPKKSESYGCGCGGA